MKIEYIEIICPICNKPILKDDKRIKTEDGKIIHNYCKK